MDPFLARQLSSRKYFFATLEKEKERKGRRRSGVNEGTRWNANTREEEGRRFFGIDALDCGRRCASTESNGRERAETRRRVLSKGGLLKKKVFEKKEKEKVNQ